MPAADRAAQFAPFAALTGFGAAITETGRLTDVRAELSEDETAVLNEKLCSLAARLSEQPTAAFTYFRPDERKSGGAYVTVTDIVKAIDAHARLVVLRSGLAVPIADLAAIDEPADM